MPTISVQDHVEKTPGATYVDGRTFTKIPGRGRRWETRYWSNREAYLCPDCGRFEPSPDRHYCTGVEIIRTTQIPFCGRIR